MTAQDGGQVTRLRRRAQSAAQSLGEAVTCKERGRAQEGQEQGGLGRRVTRMWKGKQRWSWAFAGR